MGRENEEAVPVGEDALPLGKLAADLYGVANRRPAIVVGGGPSAPSQLARLAYIHSHMIVISANGHAAKLGLEPDLIVCKDHLHTETRERMEDILRPLGAPILCRHYWADYRLARWPVQGNSGMLAIAVAAMIGCGQIFPIGFDCYQSGTYFHDLEAKNVSCGLMDSRWRSRYQRLAAKLATADVRTLDPSPLDAAFRRHNPLEATRDWCIPPIFDHYKNAKTVYVRALRPFPMKQDPTAEVPTGYVFPMLEDEVGAYLRADHVEIVDSPTDRGVQWCAIEATAPRGINP